MKGFINGDQFLLLAPATTTAQSGKTNQHSALNIFDDAPINIIWSSGAMFFTSFGRSFLRRFGSLLSVFDTCNMSVRRDLQEQISGCGQKEQAVPGILFTEGIMPQEFLESSVEIKYLKFLKMLYTSLN